MSKGEIRFYRSENAYGFLSNLYPRHIDFEGRTFTCSEAAYQFGKPRDRTVAEWLVNAPKPRFCALAAHALLPYDIRDNWNGVKIERMRNVLWAKFSQHLDLREQLLQTGNATLIEESRTDAFWGIGASGKGKNMLGALLMELREKLRKDEGD